MYGLIDHQLAEEITHFIGRRQAAAEAQELARPKRLSLIGRLLNTLPVRAMNQQRVLDIPCDEVSLSTVPCE